MPVRYALVFVLIGSCWPVFSQATNSFFQFVQDQDERRYSNVPHEVLALYYGWYGQPGKNAWGGFDTNKHEIDKVVHYPVNGPYSSHDPAIIDCQIRQAKAHGITGFVVSWWGKGEYESWHDQTLALLLDRAEGKDFKISVYWEHERNTEAQMVQFAVDDLTYVLQTYGHRNAFLKVDGKPVIFAYENVEGQTPLAPLAEIVKETRENSGDFLLIGQGYQESLAHVFDGLHTSYANMRLDLIARPSPDKLEDFRQNAASMFASGQQITRKHDRISCPMIIPGFNNSKSSASGVKADRYDGQTYRTLWEEALKTKPDWILISSWNEWPEDTEIEPSLELGDKYLEITAEYSKSFLNSPTVQASPTQIRLPQLALGSTNNAGDLLKGEAIGLLLTDSYYDPEFWADYLGATVQRLTWSDLVNSDKFNARIFPLVLYVGGEHYKSSIKTADDVTSALTKYLHEGGFLVALPSGGVWPFFYDQSRGDRPIAISDRLGLGIAGSWDTPPAGTELKFYPNKRFLSGLPPTATYPTSGDVRFRPASRMQVSTSDNYLQLVQLWNSKMQFQGDSAAYIEHKVLPLSPGKTLYVSLQIPRAFGPDEFYPSLYQFISTKLTPIR